MLWLCLLFCVLASAAGLGLPNYIQSCSRNDPNLNECALKSARESLHQFSMGDLSRGLDPLDPLFVPVMTVYVPNENGLKLVLNDNSFSGLSVLRLDDLRFDLNKKMILADALVNLDVTSKYDLSGKLLVIPIKSSGDSSIKLKNANLHIRFWYEHVDGDDGKTHWKITKHDIKYEVEKASFRLENLLNDKNIGPWGPSAQKLFAEIAKRLVDVTGDRRAGGFLAQRISIAIQRGNAASILGDQVNRLLNEMWREIVADVGPTICQSLSAAVVQNLDKLLAQVPYAELLPE